MFNLLKRSKTEDATPETFMILQDISGRCDPCQLSQHALIRFKVALEAEHVQFNERILLDITFLHGDPVLHSVEDGTKFSAAHFLPESSTKNSWETTVKCQANT